VSEVEGIARFKFHEGKLEHGAHLGEPSAELRALLAGSPVQLFTPYLSL
jgi:hypothetical protein